MMAYALGVSSLSHLVGVHPHLVAVVSRAIQTTTQDFTVLEGLRSDAAQLAAFKAGMSKLKHGLHQKQGDGFGHAVDLVPFFGGKPRWEWPLIYPIAAAMHAAATELHTPLIWGGVWDKPLLSLPGDVASLTAAVHAYSTRHPGPDFLDGPHFQLA